MSGFLFELKRKECIGVIAQLSNVIAQMARNRPRTYGRYLRKILHVILMPPFLDSLFHETARNKCRRWNCLESI
jgi:hypothetical protein